MYQKLEDLVKFLDVSKESRVNYFVKKLYDIKSTYSTNNYVNIKLKESLQLNDYINETSFYNN